MQLMLIVGFIWTVYGLTGMLLGKQILPQKYKGHTWTRDFSVYRGATWILLGVPWLLLYDAYHLTNISPLGMFWRVLIASIPSIVFTYWGDRRYDAKYLNASKGQEVKQK